MLDASVALKWVLNEPHSDKARRLRDDFKQRAHELLAPTTFIAEIGHALTRAERKGLIKPPMVAAFFSDVLSTPPVFHDFVPLMPNAVARSSAARIGAYAYIWGLPSANSAKWSRLISAFLHCSR